MENESEDIQHLFDGTVRTFDVPSDIKLKYKPRQTQLDILKFTEDSIKQNKKYILIDSPVGTGKSFAVMMLMDWYRQHYNPNAVFDILTNSKILQEQYTRDFEFINSLWGKENYHCESHNCNCAMGKEHNELLGIKRCVGCPYDEAKEAFFEGEVSLTNFHMFLTYKIFAPFAWERTSKMLLIDEAHEFEAVFCDFITNKLSKTILRRSGITEVEADKLMQQAVLYKTLESCMDFFENKVIPAMKSTRSRLKSEITNASDSESKRLLTQLNALNNNLTKFEAAVDEYKNDASNWAYEYNINHKHEFECTVQPIWAYPYLEKTVWKHYDHIIFLSGTLLDRELFAKLNGLDEHRTSYMAIPSPFPVENRPIYYMNVGKMSFKTKAETFQRQVGFVDRILKKHNGDKGIIHTVNYELAGWVNDRVRDNSRLLLHESSNRQETLDIHYNSAKATVLVSPSMINGVDLKEDFSRFQVILKMPYPNLQSEKVKRRNESMPEFYGWKTVCDLIQSYGRSIRSEKDHAITYILDGCFSDVLRRSGRFIPQYIKDAIIGVDV